jgi:UTP--glucose-1-phosphate uridylyltransferase
MSRMDRVVQKAVFPVAGLGTRFLPATKVLPKEMLVLVDRPVIQYGVEEAVRSGIDSIVLVTSRGKGLIEDHFDIAPELEAVLGRRGRAASLEEVRRLSGLARISAVRQHEALGLGHAVLVAREVIGDSPFAVLLSDDVIDAETPALRQLIDVYDRVRGPVIAVERVPVDDVSNYGIVAVEDRGDLGPRVYQVSDLVEKPRKEDAPSNLAIIGRYILTPDVFPALEGTASGRGGEIQLTDGLRRLLAERPLYVCEIEGVRHDTGNKAGFVKATAYFALRHPELGLPFRQYLESRGVRVNTPMA